MNITNLGAVPSRSAGSPSTCHCGTCPGCAPLPQDKIDTGESTSSRFLNELMQLGRKFTNLTQQITVQLPKL